MLMRKISAYVGYFCATLFVNPAWAHPGHGELGLFHHITETDPWLLALAGVALVLVISRVLNQFKR